jgi:hypothetical protein
MSLTDGEPAAGVTSTVRPIQTKAQLSGAKLVEVRQRAAHSLGDAWRDAHTLAVGHTPVASCRLSTSAFVHDGASDRLTCEHVRSAVILLLSILGRGINSATTTPGYILRHDSTDKTEHN